MAGVPDALAPPGVTYTAKEAPEAGAGLHLKAHPMFQLATVVVKGGLVQFPWSCVGPRSTRAGPAAAVEEAVVEEPAAVVVVVLAELLDPAVVVLVELEPPADEEPGDVVVVAEPVELGNV
jgi:hypothetical protein